MADFIRQASCQKLKQDYPKCVNIAASIEFHGIARYLLGAHVSQRAYKLSQIGLARGLRITVGHTRNTKIENLGLAVFIHKNVARFEVAVNDSSLMCMVYHLRQAAGESAIARSSAAEPAEFWLRAGETARGRFRPKKSVQQRRS